VPTVGIRVTDAQKIELEDRSARIGSNVSEYIKDVLFGQQDTLHQILQRLEGISPPTTGAPATSSAHVESMLAEMLLLMRFTVKPDTKRQVHAELERLGLPVWSSDDNKR
jgi:hypothetical protein